MEHSKQPNVMSQPKVQVAPGPKSLPGALFIQHETGDSSSSSTLKHVVLPLALQHERRTCRPPVRYGFEKHDIATFMSYSHISPAYKVFIASLQTVPIPSDWRAAKQDPKWKEAMKEELHAL